jgi:hypothetical protein
MTLTSEQACVRSNIATRSVPRPAQLSLRICEATLLKLSANFDKCFSLVNRSAPENMDNIPMFPFAFVQRIENFGKLLRAEGHARACCAQVKSHMQQKRVTSERV